MTALRRKEASSCGASWEMPKDEPHACVAAERDRYREALELIASCYSAIGGDVVDIARDALDPERRKGTPDA